MMENSLLLFLQENVLLCLSWLVMRGIWYFGTLVAWIRSFDVLEFNGQLSSGAGAMLDDRETLLWKIVFFGYWPLMIIYGWFSLLVIVFTCRIITTSDRRRLLDRQVRVQWNCELINSPRFPSIFHVTNNILVVLIVIRHKIELNWIKHSVELSYCRIYLLPSNLVQNY